MKRIFSNSFKCEIGDYNCMQKLESTSSDSHTSHMILKINSELRNYYKELRKNPYISSLKITMDDLNFIVNWEVSIDESPDGRAYIGLAYRGAAGKSEGVDGSIHKAFVKIDSKKKKLFSEISKNTKIADIADFNFQTKTTGFSIRQIFVIYTNPESHPYLPKSQNKDFVVGKVIEPDPDKLNNNGELISSLHSGEAYSQIMNSLFRRNKTH